MTRAELAHTLYTPELSLIAKKLPVTILRRLSARNRHRFTSRARSSVGHNSVVDNSRDSSLTYNSSRAAHSRSGNSTRRSRDNRSSGRSYRKGTGTGAGNPNSLGLGPGVERDPKRRRKAKESAIFSFDLYLQEIASKPVINRMKKEA